MEGMPFCKHQAFFDIFNRPEYNIKETGKYDGHILIVSW